MIAVFLLDPDDPGGTEKPGVIRGSGDESPPAGFRGRTPGGAVGGKAPKTWSVGSVPRS